MAKDDAGVGTGMELRALKQVLARARRTKLNVALGQGDPRSGGLGLILAHRVMPSKQLMKSLKEQFPAAKMLCFGTVSVDMATDPKQLNFQMNRRVPGLVRKVKRSVRGTGYNKVVIEVKRAE